MIYNHSMEAMPELADGSVRCCVTSPPYWTMRDYGIEGQIGWEPTLAEYVERLVLVFREVRRVLTQDGTLWLNLGDCYASKWACNRGKATVGAGSPSLSERVDRLCGDLKEKDLVNAPHAVAEGLRADGWWWRQTIIWAKENSMPAPAKEKRPRTIHEFVFLLSKSEDCFFTGECDSVWTIATAAPTGHPAPMPLELARRCIEHGSEPGDLILDPFAGGLTTKRAAFALSRRSVNYEINPDYTRQGVMEV